MSNGAYAAAYEQSISDPTTFWGNAAKAVEWITEPTTVLDDSNPPFYRWFRGGSLNTCFNALDRHVRDGRGDQAALIYDSPVTGTVQTFTYAELLDKVATFAGALASLGVEKGDRVVIYMPMVPEAVVAMLACARLGAIHSVVFGGFAPAELAARIDDAKPVVIVAASCGIEPSRVVEYKPMLDAALDRSSHTPESVIVLQRPQARAAVGERDTDWEELDWDELVSDAEPADCVEVEATDPLYVLYTSGTTGRPKGIVRDNGGHAVALRWSMENVYDIGPGDVWFTASDVGWVVGHSYIVYAPLLTGATTVLYEGKPVGTPDASAFWRVISDHGVKAMFTAPTAYRAIKREDADRHPDGRPRPVQPEVRLPGRRAARPRHLRVDHRPARRAGGRQLVADRDRLADRREPARPRPDADQGRLARRCGCPATTCRCSTTRRSRWPPGSRAPSRSGCRCPPARCRRCGRTTSATSPGTCRSTTATTSPATAA